jgi:hypothetical protein
MIQQTKERVGKGEIGYTMTIELLVILIIIKLYD